MQAGMVFCKWCGEERSYATSGKKAILSHMHSTKHKQELSNKRSNQKLPGTGR